MSRVRKSTDRKHYKQLMFEMNDDVRDKGLYAKISTLRFRKLKQYLASNELKMGEWLDAQIDKLESEMSQSEKDKFNNNLFE